MIVILDREAFVPPLINVPITGRMVAKAKGSGLFDERGVGKPDLLATLEMGGESRFNCTAILRLVKDGDLHIASVQVVKNDQLCRPGSNCGNLLDSATVL